MVAPYHAYHPPALIVTAYHPPTNAHQGATMRTTPLSRCGQRDTTPYHAPPVGGLRGIMVTAGEGLDTLTSTGPSAGETAHSHTLPSHASGRSMITTGRTYSQP